MLDIAEKDTNLVISDEEVDRALEQQIEDFIYRAGSEENFVESVKTLTDGCGVPVVYDSIGKDTFEDSLDCLQPRGLMVSFGNASGAVEPFSPAVLAAKGSLFLTRPTLATFIATPEQLKATSSDLFEVVGSGSVKIEVSQTYALEDAAQAHRDLEARKTTGSTVLLTGA